MTYESAYNLLSSHSTPVVRLKTVKRIGGLTENEIIGLQFHAPKELKERCLDFTKSILAGGGLSVWYDEEKEMVMIKHSNDLKESEKDLLLSKHLS